jgi:predicted transcriptional regulator
VTITIDLDPEVLTWLHEKGAREGQDAETVAAALLAEALVWEKQERAEAIAGIQRGLDDVAAGRARPLEEFVAEQRAKHALPELPENWQDAAELL